MKKPLFLLLLLFIVQLSYSQNNYEKGYFINNENKKTSCLIRNMDWRYNPLEFEYKTTVDSKIAKKTIDDVKEFGIIDASKYIKVNVDIDRSSEFASSLSVNKEPQFKNEQLFLKVLVEGTANLYGYSDTNLFRYFMKTENSEIRQLVFKSYLAEDKIDLLQNNAYKQELLNELKCNSISKSNIDFLKYKKRDLVKIFEKYNLCKDEGYVSNLKSKNKSDFNLSPRIGYNIASMSIVSSGIAQNRVIDFGNDSNLRFGLEFEYILPFNNNKWSLLVEPTYMSFSGEGENESFKASIDYSYFSISSGVRHYFFLSPDLKLLANINLVFPITSNDASFDYDTVSDISTSSRTNWAFGIGVNYKNKFSIEVKYELNKSIIAPVALDTDFTNISLNFGYNIF